MIDRIRVPGPIAGRQGLVRICDPVAADGLWGVEVPPVAPVDEAGQQPAGEQEPGQLQGGGDHQDSSTVAVRPGAVLLPVAAAQRPTVVMTVTASRPHSPATNGIDMPPGGAGERRSRQGLDAIPTPGGSFLTRS
jgi:hypothetical protein